MRVLHVIHSADPAGGGPIEGIKQQADCSIRAGHSIEVASLDAPGQPWMETFPIPLHALGPSAGNYGFNRQLVPFLMRTAGQFDAVVVNGLWQYSGFGVRSAMRRLGKPYFVFTHGMLDPYFKRQYPLKHLKKGLYWPWGEYRVLRDANAVFFTCEEERILARRSFRRYQANEVVVNYGTSGPDVDLVEAKERFFEKCPAVRDQPFLLFLSRIHPKKGCDLLVQAFAQVASTAKDLHLVLAGPDQTGWMSQLQSEVDAAGLGARIHWPGMLTGAPKWGAFAACEAFILPSHQENFGIVVAEALACRRPVLISDKVNIWREVCEDGAGIVESDTLEGTVRLFQRWLALGAEEKAQMGVSARACYESKFEASEAAASLMRAIARNIGHHEL